MEQRESAGRPDDESTWKRPRWVTVLLVAAAALAVLALVAVLTGVGGGHGPGRHLSTSPPSAPAPSLVPLAP